MENPCINCLTLPICLKRFELTVDEHLSNMFEIYKHVDKCSLLKQYIDPYNILNIDNLENIKEYIEKLKGI